MKSPQRHFPLYLRKDPGAAPEAMPSRLPGEFPPGPYRIDVGLDYKNNQNDPFKADDKTVFAMPPLPCAQCNAFPFVEVSQVPKTDTNTAGELGKLVCPICQDATPWHESYRKMFRQWNRRFA